MKNTAMCATVLANCVKKQMLNWTKSECARNALKNSIAMCAPLISSCSTIVTKNSTVCTSVCLVSLKATVCNVKKNSLKITNSKNVMDIIAKNASISFFAKNVIKKYREKRRNRKRNRVIREEWVWCSRVLWFSKINSLDFTFNSTSIALVDLFVRIVDSISVANTLTQKMKKTFSASIARRIFGKRWINKIIICTNLLELDKKDFLCSETVL